VIYYTEGELTAARSEKCGSNNEGKHCYISMLMGTRFCEKEVSHGREAT